MAKQQTAFFCTECGYESSGWLGRCPACSAWNTFVEERRATGKSNQEPPSKRRRVASEEGWVGSARHSGGRAGEATSLDEVKSDEQSRIPTGLSELDRVLGGGMVQGSLVLVGGDPGIGKSTLLLQVSANPAFAGPVLYVSGEESAQQIKLRAERLGIKGKQIKLLTEISFERIEEVLLALKPSFCVIDSIQTLYSEQIQSAPGTVSQVREVTAGLLRLAKAYGTTIVLVGHVTKEGALAGPRVLEHMVDTVLYFEGESSGSLRILRAVKNRFGATNELGVFEMRQEGLVPLQDASQFLLSQRPEEVPGAVVSACMEGSRPLLVELQALAVPSVFGQPQRTVQGIDRSRLQMILAVMDHHLGGRYGAEDVFLNAVGGLKLQATGLDLAIAVAIASSARKRALRPRTLVLGELGLTGELRTVPGVERCVQEAVRMGYDYCVLPTAAKKAVQKLKLQKADFVFVDRLNEAFDVLFS